jgi:hypothetical protein
MGLVLTVFICGILILSTAFPAYAVTSSRTEGEASLNRIQKKTDDVARTNPRSLEEITKESQKGLNAVQGGADKDKMVRPEDTDATSVKEKAANFIEDLTN